MKTRACLNPSVNDCKLCRIWKIRRWCSFFCFRAFSQVSSKKSIWIFDVNWLISQKFIHKDLKPVAFLVYNLEANKNRSEIPSKVLQSMKCGFPLTDRISTLNENFLNVKNIVDLVQILKKMAPRPFIEQWGLDHPWEKFMKNRFINYWMFFWEETVTFTLPFSIKIWKPRRFVKFVEEMAILPRQVGIFCYNSHGPIQGIYPSTP